MYSRSSESNPNMQETQSVMATILQNLPRECSLTKIEYEGPRIALHTNNPKFLLENNKILANIVAQIKKRIVLRIDETIRVEEEKVRKIAEKYITSKYNISDILFDPALGEAVIFLKKSETNNIDSIVNQITLETGWKTTFRKTPKIISSIKSINKIAKDSSDYRIQFYKRVGEKIFREKIDPNVETSLISLGGFAEIGRSAMLLSTNESNVLLDCGLNSYTNDPLLKFPRFDSIGMKLSEIDAVLLSHAHFDHTGFLPILFKYGYKGPVYCTEPTAYLMYILFREHVKNNGVYANYIDKDYEKIFSHLIYLNYNVVTDLTPDIKVTPYNAGHILGSSSFHFHIGNGDHNFVYTGDIKFGKSSYLENAVWNFPRVETLLIEGTNGGREDSYSAREEADSKLIEELNHIIKDKKIVLMPTQLIGTSQELIITLDHFMKEKKIKKCKIFMDEILSEINSIHEYDSEFLNKDLHVSIMSGEYNPFRSRVISVISDIEKQELSPGIVICPSSMLNCNQSFRYLKRIATDPENLIIFTSKPNGPSMAKQIIDGKRIFSNGKEEIDIKCRIETLYALSSHSDFNQLNAYISRLRPKLKKIIVNHGEKAKIQNFSSYSSKVHNISTQYMQNQEAIKLL
jgi:uncharacterized protein